MFLGAMGRGVSKCIAVGTLGVLVSLDRFLDLEAFGEEEEAREEDENVVRVNRDNNRSGLLGKPSSSVLVKVPGCANPELFRGIDGILDEGVEFAVVVWEDMGWDRVNCQLYSGWGLGKRNQGLS